MPSVVQCLRVQTLWLCLFLFVALPTNIARADTGSSEGFPSGWVVLRGFAIFEVVIAAATIGIGGSLGFAIGDARFAGEHRLPPVAYSVAESLFGAAQLAFWSAVLPPSNESFRTWSIAGITLGADLPRVN